MKINLKQLIDQGEGSRLEFKESFNSSLGKEICALANASGGKILLGVTDQGKIKGITISNDLKSKIYDLVRNADPPLEIHLSQAENILVIEVPEGRDKPYSINGKFFVRQGTNSQQLRRDEIRRFFQKEGQLVFDSQLNEKFKLDKDFNEDFYQTFLRLTEMIPGIKREDLLENLQLLQNGLLTNAGVLLFCKKITPFLLNATITCVLFRGTEKFKILDRKEFEGDLYSNYQGAFSYLQSKLNTEYIIRGGPRIEKLELPEPALREALLNAIGHRDYLESANIQVYIFSDRIEIINPGGFPPGMTYADLGKKSKPRNYLLFSMMQRMGLVEKAGTGFLRIRQAMDEYKLEYPTIEANENWFTIIFKRPDLQQESYERRNGDSLPEIKSKTREKTRKKTREKIIELIKENPEITLNELAILIGLSIKGIEWNLNKLKEDKILERVGPDKGGYWKIIEK